MLKDSHYLALAKMLNISKQQVEKTIDLINDGATIPFIARYRKEWTGSLDEVQIGEILQLKKQMDDLEKRREVILSTLSESGQLTEQLKSKLLAADKMTKLEDIYLPFKPKRKTKASIARDNGLEGLAKIIMKQEDRFPERSAERFLNKAVSTVEDALQGARYIIAEWVSENERSRSIVRKLFKREAILVAKMMKGKKEEGSKYRDYFDFQQNLFKIPSHRLLAILRAENEKILSIKIGPDETVATEQLNRLFVKGYHSAGEEVELAVKDAYKRLLAPSISTEMRKEARLKADLKAIGVFAENLRELLLAAPLGEKRVLALDPGFRTGCKVVCLDETGALLYNTTIFPHPPQNKWAESQERLLDLINKYDISAIAVGNGTAGRESESLIKSLKTTKPVEIHLISESGASVYSASKIAREEFPDHDVTVRGAVSIGRRLMDPLAELVKIDPQSIGVGQYQHDVDQKQLKESLSQVVELCVNKVGVNLNTASKHLLMFVSGLGERLAQNIVDYRTDNGEFLSRTALKKVPRMGAKAFEQAAGFLRIRNAKNPLDSSGVHPERYTLVKQMAKDLKTTVDQLIHDESLRKRIQLSSYVSDEIGMPTLKDIVKELAKPGLDPRASLSVFEFANIHSIDDVRTGMIVPGIVTNVTAFGAFVDIGIKENGLVHISQIADHYVADPSEFLKVQQKVDVKIMNVDLERKRIQLTMKGL